VQQPGLQFRPLSVSTISG
jgi:primary-amine oxidase